MSNTAVSNIDPLSQAVADHIRTLDQASAATVRPADRPRRATRSGARQVHRYPGRWLARLAAFLG